MLAEIINFHVHLPNAPHTLVHERIPAVFNLWLSRNLSTYLLGIDKPFRMMTIGEGRLPLTLAGQV